MYCKKIRDDKDTLKVLEEYISTHTTTDFTHSICPECRQKHVQPQLDARRHQKAHNP